MQLTDTQKEIVDKIQNGHRILEEILNENLAPGYYYYMTELHGFIEQIEKFLNSEKTSSEIFYIVKELSKDHGISYRIYKKIIYKY